MDNIRGLGRAMFAAVYLMIGGVLNVVYGIAAISNSSFFVHNTQYVFAIGRWFGIFAGPLAAIGALLDLPAYPFWSIAVVALSLWIIHGLVVYGEPVEAQAPRT